MNIQEHLLRLLRQNLLLYSWEKSVYSSYKISPDSVLFEDIIDSTGTIINFSKREAIIYYKSRLLLLREHIRSNIWHLKNYRKDNPKVKHITFNDIKKFKHDY